MSICARSMRREFSEFYEEYAAGNYLRYGDTLPREYTFFKNHCAGI